MNTVQVRKTIGRRGLAGVLWCAFAALPPLVQAQEAMLMDVSGEATVSSGGKEQKAAILDYVAAGTVLKLDAGAKAQLVLLAPGSELSLSGPGSYRIQADRVETLSGAKPASAALDAAIGAQARKFEPAVRERMGMAAIVTRDVGMRKAPKLQGPGGQTVLSRTPQFWWSSAMPAPATLTLWDADGAVLWQGKDVQPGVQPDKPLAPGDYEWAVQENGAGTGRAMFTVADDAARAVFPPLAAAAPFAERLARAMALDNAGYNHDAWTLWKQLAAERPGNKALAKLAQ
jgi:hypothetical protein